MAQAVPALLSPEEYLQFELDSSIKHEFLGGVVHAMSGGINQHARVSVNCLLSLGTQLRGKPCFPINSDVKIRIQYADHTRFYYPDAGVVCESNPPSDHFQDKPVVLIEVLSPTSRRTDMTEKRDAYLTIPSLAAYLIIDPDKPEVTVHQIAPGGLSSKVFNELSDTIQLPEIDAELSLAEVYEGVNFE
jgi:Uma2 family endonuclease